MNGDIKVKTAYKQRLKNPPEILVKYSCYAKDLWNQSNYILLNEYQKTGRVPYVFDKGGKTTFERLMHATKNLDGEINWTKLPSCCAQNAGILLFNSWRGWVASLQSYKRDKSKFSGVPRPPQFLPKNGKQVIEFTNLGKFDGDVVMLGRASKGEGLLIKLKCDDKRKEQIKKTCKSIKIVPKANNEYEICFVYDDIPVVASEKIAGRLMTIDIGVNNLATCFVNDVSTRPLIINGGIPKSINCHYNKKTSLLKSQLTKGRDVLENKKKGKLTSKQINTITNKRNRQIHDYFHKASKMIVDYATLNKVEKIYVNGNIGDMKQGIDLGKRANQKIVQIPWKKLIDMIEYKARRYEVEVIRDVDESYTSKTDHVVLESMVHQEKYAGSRIKRGLFKSSAGIILNADVNGAVGIARKVSGDEIVLESVNWKTVMNPLKVNAGDRIFGSGGDVEQSTT